MATPSPISEIRNCTTKLHLAEGGQPQHEQEGREDRDRRDQQRQQGQERREDEQQHEQRARGPEQGLGEHARPLGVTAGRQQPVRRQPALEPGLVGRLGQGRLQLCLDARPEGRRRWPLDQGVRRQPVGRDERLVTRGGVVGHQDPGNGRGGRLEDAVDRVDAARDGLAVRHRHHHDVRVERAHPVALDELVLGVVARLSRQREVEGQPVAELAGSDATEDERDEPEEADDQPVTHDETSETLHGDS